MQKHISGIINDETKRLRFLVEKVLQMSMFDRQNTSLKLRDINVNEIINSVVHTFDLKVQSYGGTLQSDLGATEAIVVADEMHITNVIFNLLDNAVKYRREKVPLTLVVRTWNESGKLCISVKDNGGGIKKDDLKHIFDKFYRVHTGNKHDVKGFGLGLAYVKKIINEHHGTIRTESEPGEGTTFIITLPTIKA
jgi:signal transduction histidine kinase